MVDDASISLPHIIFPQFLFCNKGNIEGTNASKIYVWCLCIYVLFQICVRDWFCRFDLKKYWYDYEKNFEINVHLFDRPEMTLCGWQDDKQDDALPRLLRETNSVLLEKIWNKNDKDTSLSCQQSSKRRHCHANSLPSDVIVMPTVFQATSLSCQQSSKHWT